MKAVEIVETGKARLREPIFLEGFPGVGMIGSIGASYLAENLEMTPIGYIDSDQFPPVTAIHDYKPISPARIYASEKHDLIVLDSEFVIPVQLVRPLVKEIIDYAKKKKAKMIYSIAGIACQPPNCTDKIYGIASTEKVGEFLKKKGVELIREGATQGVSGILISECSHAKIDAANIMVQTPTMLNVEATARLLGKWGEMTKIPVDTKELLEEGKKINEKMASSLKKMNEMKTNYAALEDNPMYG